MPCVGASGARDHSWRRREPPGPAPPPPEQPPPSASPAAANRRLLGGRPLGPPCPGEPPPPSSLSSSPPSSDPRAARGATSLPSAGGGPPAPPPAAASLLLGPAAAVLVAAAAGPRLLMPKGPLPARSLGAGAMRSLTSMFTYRERAWLPIDARGRGGGMQRWWLVVADCAPCCDGRTAPRAPPPLVAGSQSRCPLAIA